MPNDNRIKKKNPAVEEIENDNAPIPEDSPDYVKPEEVDPTLTVETPPVEPETPAPTEPVTPPANPETPAPIEPTPTPPPAITPEEQLAEQRREAQILHSQNTKITETIDKAAALPEPTEEELRNAARQDGAEWDDLTEFERKLFKKNYINDKRFEMVHQVTKDIHQIDEWATKVDQFITDEESKQLYKPLSGHEGEFRHFAMMESHRGVDIDILINAFLNKLPPTVRKTGALFPTGGGEPPEPPKTDTITDADEASKLKISDPREYGRKLRAGKIKIEV